MRRSAYKTMAILAMALVTVARTAWADDPPRRIVTANLCADRLVLQLADRDSVLVAPPPDDGHPDHEAVGRATLRAAERAAAGEAIDGDPELAESLAALVATRAAALADDPPPVASRVAGRLPRPGITASITGIARYRSCPLQFRFAHVDRIPPRPDPSREVGTAAHAALEAFFRPGAPAADAEQLVGRFAAELTRARVDDTPQARHALALAGERFPGLVARTRTRNCGFAAGITTPVSWRAVYAGSKFVVASPSKSHCQLRA